MIIASTLSPAIQTQAKAVMADGIMIFSKDQKALLEICRLAALEVKGKPWDQVHSKIVSTLRACDSLFNWQTGKIRPGETDVERQARENAVYQMMATIYLLGTEGVRIGL